ncbi:MAG TPA: ABC-type transport auxiliary lipoprotein family protein [Acidobacteriaceae bacterium]|jgi:ABC-type uncharacterized transport system auxiliary subunit
MRNNRFLLGVAFALTVFIAGCGRIKYPSYHTLTMAPELKPKVRGAHPPVTVAVQEFKTPAYLRQGRIVYSKAPGDIGFYEYHRWATDPGAAVTTAVIESLRAQGVFSSAAPYAGIHSADYLLSGRLDKLEEVDYGGGVSVQAKLSAELMNLRTGSIVWSGDAAESSRVEGRDVNAVVAAMSHAMQKSINSLLTGMEHQVSGT